MIMEADKELLKQRGIQEKDIASQIESFKSGFPKTRLVAPAVINDGITVIDNHQSYVSIYDQSKVSTVKFVPASGAASRMFKLLFQFYGSDEVLAEDHPVFKFFKNLERFAFYDELKQAFKTQHGYSLEEAHLKKEYNKILASLLEEDGLNYGKLPKGLLDFHSYASEVRKPVKEHIEEGISYAKKDNQVNIHFTVSPEHMGLFKSYVEECVEAITEDSKIHCSYSVQDPSTDTIAVTLENAPFRVDNNLFFRPAGHGALLHNLDALKEDIVFIKNIDNVVPDRLKEETILYKKVLAGMLLKYQEKVFDLLSRNDKGENIVEAAKGLLKEMGVKGNVSDQQVLEKLNRPIRVCGMVKNQGEPGGGPFWVVDKDGTISLQIVESVQVDHDDEEQEKIFKSSTHFNPVDLVCSLKNYKGEKFSLMKYRDSDTGIITEKSHGSTKIKAMELPGLWNGSMADWNTLFIEVPLITFNPVKTVMDLLRPEHQPA
jgi:hypothetical protein